MSANTDTQPKAAEVKGGVVAYLQVDGAKTCIVSNQGGIMHTHSTLIVGNHL